MHEITNSPSLMKVKRLLPADLKRRMNSLGLDDNEKNENLVKFLAKEPHNIEYMEDEERLTKADTKISAHLASTESESGVSTLVQAVSK